MAINWKIQDSTDNESFKNTGEFTPVQYPRSDENRGQVSWSNKGAASREDEIYPDREMNPTGDGESPRRMGDVNYDAGPYPVVEEGTGGVDEGDGASR